MPDKLDLFKHHKPDYVTPKTPKLVEIAPAPYLAVDGDGPPGTPRLEACVGAVYGMAYTLKFAKKAEDRDFVVCKLEGLYDCAEPEQSEGWSWTLLIRMPESVAPADLDEARAALRERAEEGDFDAVRLDTLDEGRCVQVLHVGPYGAEGQSIALMQAFMEAEGLTADGRHHEIYLSDPRRVPPEKLRTILRQPVREL